MKLPDPEQFNFKECEVAGDACWLITPKEIGCKWTDEIARFRSVIITQKDHVTVSQGFGKFTNYGERPEFEPWDDTWDFEARHKLDGSLLIVSYYKGQLVVRTRGTVDARNLQNGHEIDILMKKYPKAFDNWIIREENVTLLFEWTTPSNIIVLREHDEPTLTLLGVVGYGDELTNSDIRPDSRYGIYYFSEDACDIFATTWEVPRPVAYHYASLAECLLDVVAWEGKEGVVMRKGQIRRKVKSDLYNELHKISSGLVTVKNIVELFMATPKFTKYSDFYHFVENAKSYEVAEKIKDHMLAITVAYCKVLEKIERVKNVVEQVRNGFNRREQAQQFQLHWKVNDWRLPAAFSMLDNKPIVDKLIQTAILTELLDV